MLDQRRQSTQAVHYSSQPERSKLRGLRVRHRRQRPTRCLHCRRLRRCLLHLGTVAARRRLFAQREAAELKRSRVEARHSCAQPHSIDYIQSLCRVSQSRKSRRGEGCAPPRGAAGEGGCAPLALGETPSTWTSSEICRRTVLSSSSISAERLDSRSDTRCQRKTQPNQLVTGWSLPARQTGRHMHVHESFP